MINIDDMAKMIEDERPKSESGTPAKNDPPAFSEERAAEMIETAFQARNAEFQKTIEGLNAEIATLKNTIAELSEKGKENA